MAVPDLLWLSPLEASSILTDRAREPHTIELEATVAGPVDAAVLRAAVRAAITRHPLARVHLARTAWWQRRLRWTLLDEAPDPVIVHSRDWGQGCSPASDLVPADRDVLFRVDLYSAPTTSRVLLAINHAAFDGLGAVRLLRSIAAFSSGLPDPEPAADALAARWAIA